MAADARRRQRRGDARLRGRHAVSRSIAASTTRHSSVAITTATAGATIRYTTDGSVPRSRNGTTYTGPINIADDDDAARPRLQGRLHVRPTSTPQTYIFLDDVIQQDAADVTQPYATWGHDKEDADSHSGYNLDDESDWEMDPDIVTGNEASGEKRPDVDPDDVGRDGLGRSVRRHAACRARFRARRTVAPAAAGNLHHGLDRTSGHVAGVHQSERGERPVPDRRGDRNSGPFQPDALEFRQALVPGEVQVAVRSDEA